MEKPENNKYVLDVYSIIFLVSLTIWHTFSTAYGTITILGSANNLQVFITILFTIITLMFLMATFKIWKDQSNIPAFNWFLRSFWLLSLAYSLFTTYLGNLKILSSDTGNPSQIVLVIGVTAFVSLNPILISYFMNNKSIL